MTHHALVRAALAAAFGAYAGMASPAWAAGGAAAQGPTGPASRAQISMTIYAGGITLGNVDMDATIRSGAYHVVSNLTTSGVANAFWKAQIQATSSGKVADGKLQPALYDSFTVDHSGHRQEVSLTYDADGAPRLYANPAYSVTGYEVKPQDQKNTLDPLSAVLFIISGVGTRPDNPCGVVAPIFDGRRRYNIEVRKVRNVAIDMDNDLYKGKGLLCTLRYRQLAGFKPRVIRSNEEFPVINAWITTVHSTVRDRDYVVPLRVWADTKYGVVAVVADSVKVDNISLDSRTQ